MKSWSIAESDELYQIRAWGQGYFRVNERGHVVMDPPGREGSIDLKIMVDDLRRRGIEMPVLVRFSDLVRERIETMVSAFERAGEEYGYTGSYRGVYPIKVNQDAHVVGDVVRYSAPHHLGLEAGSKPELMIVLAMLDDPEALIICNGYKDRAYVQMALIARKLGKNCVIVVEQASEIDLILRIAEELGIEPVIGIRAKLASKGSGRWQSSAGDRAKFGLTVREIVRIVHELRETGKLGSLRLLHFHIGSQVTNIRSFHGALREAMRIYTELVRLGAALEYIDVGGGLGVDYDGSRTNFDSSMNYSVQEYAYSVISAVVEACGEAQIPHPHLITESGRAVVAHHAMLIFDVLGVTRMSEVEPSEPSDEDSHELSELWEIYNAVSNKNLLEPLHDAMDIRDQCLTKFRLGLADLEQRAAVDEVFFAICQRLHQVALRSQQPIPEEIEPLERLLADIYYCNFSVFQSVPDVWAIKQLFPVLPIHRLDRRPTRRAVLADLTCDSDGKIDRFIDRRDVKPVLEVHELGSGPYYLGMFLVGAYQEILGDLHNLFGDTNEVHVEVAPGRAGYTLEAVVEGNSVREVLNYVSYDRKRLIKVMRRQVEAAIEAGQLTPEEGGLLINTYNAGLESYTYLS
ncbi:MAG TPA: biosynthetic arginine decarboxylase [Deltaproteobacteria bacterium]|nr:biosynthetic arginine decarboxylase [Deltaproteobacteria bacterium]